jgi:hypothetical protein
MKQYVQRKYQVTNMLLSFLCWFIGVVGANAQAVVPVCGGAFEDIEATIYPSDTLAVGDNAYLYLKYSVPDSVSNGTVVTSLNFNGVPYPDTTSVLCNEKDVSCPINQGTYSFNNSFSVPNIEGSIHTKIHWISDTNVLLLCLKLFINIIPNHIR